MGSMMNIDFLDLTIYATAAILLILISYVAQIVWRQRVEMYDTEPREIERDYLEHKAKA